jgi:hypothetical protein
MLAGAIPIYWGAKEVSSHFNEKSFINVHAFPNVDAAIEEIKRIDQNDEAYQAMLQEPWFKENKLPIYFDANYLQQKLKI